MPLYSNGLISNIRRMSNVQRSTRLTNVCKLHAQTGAGISNSVNRKDDTCTRHTRWPHATRDYCSCSRPITPTRYTLTTHNHWALSMKWNKCEINVSCSIWVARYSRVFCVLDSGAEGPGFKSQPRRCRVTVLGKLFTPIVLLCLPSSETGSSPLMGCGDNCRLGGK